MNHRRSLLLMSYWLLFATACAPYPYVGTAALLEGKEIQIIRRDHDWGDCYRVIGTFPTVYKLSRPAYELNIAHGDRYWPQLFFRAETPKGTALGLEGNHLSPVQFPESADMGRLISARGFVPTHELALREFNELSADLQVFDSQHHLLGQEHLSFRIEDVKCFGWDSL